MSSTTSHDDEDHPKGSEHYYGGDHALKPALKHLLEDVGTLGEAEVQWERAMPCMQKLTGDTRYAHLQIASHPRSPAPYVISVPK